jgi:hypothetical protein
MFGLVMIVKDEAERIGPCLASLRPVLRNWTVLDTGSTDGTQDIVRAALEGIPGKLYEDEFVNFGSARSRAFALARGTADWLLASDADMFWEIDADWKPDMSMDSYMVEMGSPQFSHRLPLVLRGDRPWKSVGAVHEYTCLVNGLLGKREFTDAVRVTHPGAKWSEERGRWYLELLAPGVAAGDPRAIFYAAQTHKDLGELPEAMALYERRAMMGGWAEEAAVAAYRAWEMRPTRLEPLYDAVAALNDHEAFQTAHRLASIKIEPCTDVLFVHGDVWKWGLRAERDRAAAGIAMEEAA